SVPTPYELTIQSASRCVDLAPPGDAPPSVSAPWTTWRGWRRHAHDELCARARGVDRFLFRFSRYFDPSGLRSVGNRDGHGEHAVFVGGVNVVGVESVAQQELAREGPLTALAGDDLIALDGLPVPFRGDGHAVAFHGQIDGGGIDARQVEVDHEAVAVPIGVHWDTRLAGLTPGLVQHSVEFPHRVEAHE